MGQNGGFHHRTYYKHLPLANLFDVAGTQSLLLHITCGIKFKGSYNIKCGNVKARLTRKACQ